MGEKEEKGVKKIHERIHKRIQEQEKKRKAGEEAARKEKANQEKAEQIYQNWLKEHEEKARKAAHVIWNWYEEFISSPIFKEMADTTKEESEIQISEIISCSIPHRKSVQYTRTEEQMLTIAESGSLFVHNCLKYGKSYEICHREDLFEYVALPVLIEIAKTITDETIWDIINFR